MSWRSDTDSTLAYNLQEMRVIIAIAMAWLGVMLIAQQIQDVKQLKQSDDEQSEKKGVGED